MRIVGKGSLPPSLQRDLDVVCALHSFYAVAKAASWTSLDELLQDFPRATVLAADRVHIDLGPYRVLVALDFHLSVAWILSEAR